MADRKIVVHEHLSMDGVLQGPGGPDEDRSGSFHQGGWTGPFSDPVLTEHFQTQLHRPFDLLLGRRTYDIWEPYWPHHGEFWPEANAATKYVASRTRSAGTWEKTIFLNGDLADSVRELKAQPGPDLHVWGSSEVVQELLRHDLIDEFWLVIYPIVLGAGKRLFGDGLRPRSFQVIQSATTPRGVLVVRYQRGVSTPVSAAAVGFPPATKIQEDLALQYSHLWELFRRLVRDFDTPAWTSVGSSYLRPARVSLHILGAVKYYMGVTSFQKFASGKAFDLEWTIAEESLLPDQADLLAAIAYFEKQSELWISGSSFQEENVEFPWCGKSRLAVITYLLRHSHHHVGELNLLLQLSKNGQAADHWDQAMN